MKKTRTWAEVDLEALEHNYRYLRSLAPDSQFLGLCKANAYGNGAEIIASALASLGAEMLAVATAEEGVTLREYGISLPILILGDSPEEEFPLLLEYHLFPTVHSATMGEALESFLKKENQTLSCHVKIDTGMGRLGFFSSKEVLPLFAMKHLNIVGIYTHFPSSESDDEGTTQQWKSFQTICNTLLNSKGKVLYHACNSGATLYHQECHGDMIRPGIALYGYDPKGVINENLRPVLSFYAKVSIVRAMKKGDKIGYGGTDILAKDSLVAVLPVGYGDGYPRFQSNGGMVLIEDKLCPILGRVCMDMMMVDVTSLHGVVKTGTVATLWGTENLLLDIAQRGNTITYELLCHISKRVPRYPIHNNGSI
ncbi:MAG: alanine racemase [Eubacteriales bacterium]